VKVIDSSVLVALFFPEDKFHGKARRLIEQNANESILLSELILFETLTVLNYYIGVERTKIAYDNLLNDKQLVFTNFSDAEKREILAVFFSQAGKKLSVQDCSVIYQARRHKIEPLTFDGGINLALGAKIN